MMARESNPDGTDRIQTLREQVCQRIGSDRMSLWFGDNATWTVEENQLAVSVDNEFLADCIRSFCMKDLRALASEIVGCQASVLVSHRTTPLRADGASQNGALEKANPSQAPRHHPSLDSNVQTEPVSPQTRAVALAPLMVSPPELERSENSYTNGISRTKKEEPAQVFSRERPDLPAGKALSVYRGVTSQGPSNPSHENQPGMKVDHWSEFIESPSNKLAKTAAQMVIERPGTLTPVLIHGPTGVGKSHLARGIAEQLRSQHRMRRVIYLTAEQFTIDFTDSARGSGFASFRKKYRDIDAFILDDAHFLLGKGGTLLELRNTVDNLIRNQRQVIFVSDRSLNELSGLGNELHARLSGGMTCSLEPLDEEGRVLLLSKLAKRFSVTLESETVRMLARLCGGDARILHGLAFRLLTAQRSKNRSLTTDEILDCSRDLLRASQPVVRMLDIEKAVCDIFGLEPKSLQTKTKSKTVSQPRMLAMFLARKYTRAAYSEIGQFFGNRQHSTVISAQKKVEDWLERNEVVGHSRGSVAVRDMLRNLEATLQVG